MSHLDPVKFTCSLGRVLLALLTAIKEDIECIVVQLTFASTCDSQVNSSALLKTMIRIRLLPTSMSFCEPSLFVPAEDYECH